MPWLRPECRVDFAPPGLSAATRSRRLHLVWDGDSVVESGAAAAATEVGAWASSSFGSERSCGCVCGKHPGLLACYTPQLSRAANPEWSGAAARPGCSDSRVPAGGKILRAAPQTPCGVRGVAAEPPGPWPARDACTRKGSPVHPRWGCSRRAPGPPTARGGSGMPRAREPPSGRLGARDLPSPPERASCNVGKTSRPRCPPLAEHRPLQELHATNPARSRRDAPPESTRTAYDLGAPCSG